MPDLCTFDYAVVRIVPRVERGEFLNVGILLFCATERSLRSKVVLDRPRLAALAPEADLDDIEEHLHSITLITHGGKGAGPLGALSPRERFHWLVAPRSTVIQVSPVHSGWCENLEQALERLFDKMVRPPVGRDG